MELSEHNDWNDYAIELVKRKQPFYKPIYSLGLVKLDTLKTNIKTYFKTKFIQPFKSPPRAPILFDQKLDGSFVCMSITKI